MAQGHTAMDEAQIQAGPASEMLHQALESTVITDDLHNHKISTIIFQIPNLRGDCN